MGPRGVDVIIVGAGLAGLTCARHLHRSGAAVTVFEGAGRIGGRIKTDRVDGFLLDHGFQVLQTAYPEVRNGLNMAQLCLRRFPPGVIVCRDGHFHTLADPLRRPKYVFETATAPVGSLADRWRLLKLARDICRGPAERLVGQPETTAMDFLVQQGFSARMRRSFFVPFFGGVCLDSQIRASSRVLRYVFRMFATGDAALPEKGMEMIPRQIARQIPSDRIHTGRRVDRVVENRVILEDGSQWHARAVVVATQGPEAQRLLNRPVSIDSAGETCIYFSTRQAPVKEPFLVLNGDGRGPVNNVAFPSMVSPAYAPRGRHLVSAVVLDQPPGADQPTESQVRSQMSNWFGPSAMEWDHLKTYRITHALPNQAPPTPDPTKTPPGIGRGIYVCGEYGSLPGIQWAMLSGRRAAEAVAAHLRQ